MKKSTNKTISEILFWAGVIMLIITGIRTLLSSLVWVIVALALIVASKYWGKH